MPKLRTPAPAATGESPQPGAPPNQARLSVPRREAVPDLSCLPEKIVTYFSARGYRVTLASMHQTTVMQLSVNERFPLCLDDIDIEEDRVELKQALTRQGFQIKEGFPQRGDCYIYVQPEDARDEQLRRGHAVWLGQDDPASLDEALTEFNHLFRANGLSNTSVSQDGGNGRLSDHVGVWEE